MAHLFIVVSVKWGLNIVVFTVKRLNPVSHFKSRLSLIVLVNVVLNRTVVFDSD